MQSDQVIALFKKCGALLDGHFILSSGLHSSGYLQSALVLQHPKHATAIGVALADRVSVLTPGVVVSPALGGLIIGHEVARALGVRALFVERQDGKLVLRRGFNLEPGERLIVVEDVVTTGGSTQETINLVRELGGVVVGASTIINRGGQHVFSETRLEALAEVSLPTYELNKCPLCIQGVSLTKPGSRNNSK